MNTEGEADLYICSLAEHLLGGNANISLHVGIFKCTNQQWESFPPVCTYWECRGINVC